MFTNKPWLLCGAILAVEAALRHDPPGATTVAGAFSPELSFEAGGELLAAA